MWFAMRDLVLVQSRARMPGSSSSSSQIFCAVTRPTP
jgi:hypothetical protein